MREAAVKEGRGLLDRLVRWGALLVVLLGPTQYSIEVAPKTYVCAVDPAVWLVGFLWGLRVLRDRAVRSVRFPPLLTLAFVALAALSILKSENRLSGLKDLFQIVEYFGVSLTVFASEAASPGSFRRLTLAFLAAGTAVVALALAHYWMPQVSALDVRGTFGNRNVLGGFLSILLPLAYGVFLFDTGVWRRCWCLALVLCGVSVTLSGGSFAGLALALGAVSAIRGTRTLAAYGAGLALLLAVGLPALPRNNAAVLHDSIALYDGNVQVSRRYPEWQAAVVMSGENPWLGVGLGNYQANIGQHYGTLPDATGPAEPDIQNLYLVLASSAGLPAALCFGGMLLWFWARAAACAFAARDPWLRGAAAGLAGSVLAFAVNSVWSPLLVRGIGVPLAVVFGLIAALGMIQKGDAGAEATRTD